MATEDFQDILERLYYDRRLLSALVFEPLQEIKDFVARNLRSDEIPRIAGLLGNAIRSDTLRTITDGEALIAVLNLYYGKDNLRVLQRLLRKINCHDLLEILSEWDVRSNPVNSRVFRECGYFPLWVRIKNSFTWFSENKKRILQTIRRLFRIPEISPGDPDYETVTFMGVSFGKTDLLVYVLVPLYSHEYIHTTLGRNDISSLLLQSHISGVYFGRKTERNGFNTDPAAVTSFTSINESLQGDYTRQPESNGELHPTKMNGLYNGLDQSESQKYFHDVDPNQRVGTGGLKVVRASVGYIDATSSASKASSISNTVSEPIRVVRPRIMYLDHGNLAKVDVEDSPRMRAMLYEDTGHKNVRRTVESSNVNTLQGTLNRRADDFPEGEVESLIVPEVKNNRKGDWKIPDVLSHKANEQHTISGNYYSENTKWKDYGKSDKNEHRTSVFSEDKNNDDCSKEWPSYTSPQNVLHGTSDAAKSAFLTESDVKKMYTSTATLQVNMRNKNTIHKDQPMMVNDGIYRSKAEASIYESKPNESLVSSSRHCTAESGEWYVNDSALDDYERQMIPEPEPDEKQWFNQNDAFYQHQMSPEEESPKTPLVSPPTEFRDTTSTGSKLVKVTTKFLEQPVQQASLISPTNENRTDRDEQLVRQIPMEAATASNVSRSGTVQYDQNRLEPVFVHRRPFLMKSDSKLESEYEDSVFTDTESHKEIITAASSRFAPPPYLPPPEYNGKVNRSKLSDESVSSDTSDHMFKSQLLSAASVSSIYREMELCKELMVAAKTGDEDELKTTIEEGVDVNYQNEFGQSAMMVASWEGHHGIIEALLSADADPNLQDGFGKSALHEAALSGHHTIVNRLISGGAKINLTDEEQRTPLHYAAMRGKRKIVEVLVLFGADVTLLTKYNESAIELAYSYRHDDIVDYLMASSRDKKTRREMESQIRRQKLKHLSSATSLPNLSKVSSMKELSRSRSRPDLRKKKSVCPIQ
ncbi:uncharacterized protein [Porites lutea]|uniref:uncharacterized protein isoform X2 n=1 Tax=Porites lutea TaxID=51062 RepID=UPI003CC66323